MGETKYMTVNMGPQHPATHGVLRVLLELDGEYIIKATPIIGHLHRGVEKLAEERTYHQFIPFTDRLDYTAGMNNNLAYVMAVEKLLGIEVPKRAQYIRVAMAEFQRIAAHLIWLGTHALDMGAMTVLFYTFRERETVLNILEHISGARLTPSFMRIGGLASDVPENFETLSMEFVEQFPGYVDGYETLLSKNPIWLERTKGVGYLSREDALSYGVTGPALRGSGVDWDIRKKFPYSSYEDFDFDVPLGTVGDVYDRYTVRIEEMRQSIRIIKQVITNMPSGEIIADDPAVCLPKKDNVYNDIDALIRHFKIASFGFEPPAGEVFFSAENPKGELGFYLISDGTHMPFRIKIRNPSYYNLSALPIMIEGRLIADVVSVIGSIDIVLGEIDK